MGTINYGTSNYITLGIKPYDYSNFENDPEVMEAAKENSSLHGTTIEEEIESYINSCYEDDFANAESILSKYSFYYFHVALKPGYYEGCYIDIEYNYPVAFDWWQEKAAAQKEITQLKRELLELAGIGFVECFPGWGTGYSDYKKTVAAINQAVKTMREEVRNTPTWAQYSRETA